MIRDSFQVTRDAAARRPRTARLRAAADVVISKVDPRVWSTALRLAQGDVSRIERISETAVRVR